MLYVFYVDNGMMKTFDMNLALESVNNLKQHIQNVFRIPSDKQVLLISGGECLDPSKRVCSYSAGTDTNPIFLFSKACLESLIPPRPNVEHGSDLDMDAKVREHCDMPVTLNTVVKRATLAQHFHELAKELFQLCENLVHDQHLMQQGWFAVVANMDDILLEFKKRCEIFEKSYQDYMQARESYMLLLQHFNSDLEVLQRIPVLPVLIEREKTNLDSETSKPLDENTNDEASQESMTNKEISLLDWISSSDDKSTIEQLYQLCVHSLEQLDEKVFQTIKLKISKLMLEIGRDQMKEVQGLGERLSGLETLMREAKNYVRQQAELAQSFLNNQSRASNTNDLSVLPDLCISHKRQLQMMADNHQHLIDIRRRCANAKEELCNSLHHRLIWVTKAEGHILEIDQNLVIYHENLKRLRRHLEVLQQIHLAPATYLCAVAEVVRRRTFSQSFLLWASELACHLLTIHNEEVTRRKEFQSQFEGHFLNSLFPGMEDLPPSFATQAPSMFDGTLPKITQEDIDRLRNELPDLAENLNLPDTSAVTNFFLMKSILRRDEEKSIENKSANENMDDAVAVVHEVASNVEEGNVKVIDAIPHAIPILKDVDRGCESETDTEEFEKVGQSPLELNFDKNIPLPQSKTQDASTLTEDNLQISRSEHEKLKSCLVRLHALAKEAITQLRCELSDLKDRICTEKQVLVDEWKIKGGSFERLLEENTEREKQILNNILEQHQVEITKMKLERQKDTEYIHDLETKNIDLEARLSEFIERVEKLDVENMNNKENLLLIDKLEKKLKDKESEFEKIVKETTDRLNREHKAAIENIRSRYKLMTMERSPSDTNLEKSCDFSSLPSHTTLLVQMTENFEMDKEKAVSEAIKMEREKWERLVAKQVEDMDKKFQEEKDTLIAEVFQKVSDEKDKQIEYLMEREKNLNLECLKYRNTIQQLAECERESECELIERVNELQREKDLLSQELEKLKDEKVIELTTSVALVEGKVDATTSPIKQKEILSRSDILAPPPQRVGKLNIDTCKAGDQVLVLWDPTHENFMVLQENKQHMYFLHSEYLDTLGLEIIEGKPNRLHCLGEVIDKEYCHARKAENRYKVPKGTKFFRVKVRSLNAPSTSSSKSDAVVSQSLYQPKSSNQDLSRMSQSQSTISTISDPLDDKSGCQSLPTTPTRTHPVILERDEPDGGQMPNIFGATDSSVEKHFAEDSGIVTNVEQATVATLDDTLKLDGCRNDSESSDRTMMYEDKLEGQRTYISSTWLEMMISRVFAKSVQNTE